MGLIKKENAKRLKKQVRAAYATLLRAPKRH
jgi:hypothetical protein